MTKRCLILLTLPMVMTIAINVATAADITPAANCAPRSAERNHFKYKLSIMIGLPIMEHAPRDVAAARLVLRAGEKFNADQWEEAIALFNQALDQTPADEHEARAEILHEISVSQARLKQFAAAETTLRKAIPEAQAAQGLTPSSLVALHQTLIAIVFTQERYVEAEQLIRGNLERLRTRSRDDPQLLEAKRQLGAVLFAQKRYKEAEPAFREALERARRQSRDANDMAVVLASARLGEVLQKQERFKDALPYSKLRSITGRTTVR